MNAPGQFAISAPYTSGSPNTTTDNQSLYYVELFNNGVDTPVFVSQSGQLVTNQYGDTFTVHLMVTCSKYV